MIQLMSYVGWVKDRRRAGWPGRDWGCQKYLPRSSVDISDTPSRTHQRNGVRLRRLMWFASPLKGAASPRILGGIPTIKLTLSKETISYLCSGIVIRTDAAL
jgi:hypothetical protein